MAELLYISNFIYLLIGFFVGRISMAIQYALLKEMARSKKKETINRENVFK